MIRILLLLLILVPGLAQAQDATTEEVLAGLSENRVSITANFDGSQILVFGAVKRDGPPPPGELGVIVTVAGPLRSVTVRRKAHRFGIWVNTDSVLVDAAPSYYAVASTGPLDTVISATEDLRHRVSILNVIRSVGNNVHDSPSFTEALIRIRSEQGLYQILPGSVTLTQDTLFSTSVTLPANLIEGEYRTRVFLTRGGKVINEYVTGIRVEKSVFEKFFDTLAHTQPFIYGVLCLVIAAAAGWSASAVFRLIRS